MIYAYIIRIYRSCQNFLTALGALSLYISDETVKDFQPMNINFGIISPLGYRVKGKRNKNQEISQRSLEIIEKLKQEIVI